MGCFVWILENKDVEGGIVNGVIGMFKGFLEYGKYLIIELKNGKLYMLYCFLVEIFVDMYFMC